MATVEQKKAFKKNSEYAILRAIREQTQEIKNISENLKIIGLELAKFREDKR